MRRNLTTIATLALFLVPALAFGQKVKLEKARFAQKGKVHVGGTVFSYSSMTNDDSKDEESHMAIMPEIGYFVMPGLELGLMLNYKSDGTKPDKGDEVSNSESGAGLFGAYYHKVSPIMFPYARASYSFFSKDGDSYKDMDVSGNELRVGAGLAIAVGHKVGGVFHIRADYVKQSMTISAGGHDNDTSTSGFQLGTGLSIFFSVI